MGGKYGSNPDDPSPTFSGAIALAYYSSARAAFVPGSERSEYLPEQMPFTLAHPAATLPFLRLSRINGWRSGLLWGSLSPDLIAVPLVFARSLSHSIPGLLLLDVPLALLLAWLWNAFGRNRFSRLPGLTFPVSGGFSWRAAMLGALIGGASHLFWDVFTHDKLPAFVPCSICSEKLFDTPAGPFVVGHLSWYLNSALGTAIVLVWLLLAALRSPGGAKAFLSPVWLRLLVLPVLPILYFLVTAHPGVEHPLRDVFLSVILYPYRVRVVVVLSAVLGFAVLAWETRPRPRPS